MATAAGKLKEISGTARPRCLACAGLWVRHGHKRRELPLPEAAAGAIGTNNIDSEARLGYAPAQAILR